MKYSYILLPLAILIINGCQNSSQESKKPYLIGSNSSVVDVKKDIKSNKTNRKDIPKVAKINHDINQEKKSLNIEQNMLNINKTIEAKEKVTIKNLDVAHLEKMATIEAEKDKSLKRIELEKIKYENQTKKEIRISELSSSATIEKEKQKYDVKIAIEEMKLHKQYLLASMVALLVVLLLIFLLHRRNSKLKIKLHEDKLNHEAKMQESRHYHEKVTKTLDLLADEKTGKALKKELIVMLKGDDTPKLIGK